MHESRIKLFGLPALGWNDHADKAIATFVLRMSESFHLSFQYGTDDAPDRSKSFEQKLQ